MKRRDLILLLGSVGAAIAWNPALAGDSTPRIGFIGAGLRPANQRFLDALRDGLRTLGWNDGGNLVILDRWAEERSERLPGIARELIGSPVDILVTVGTPATLAATNATARLPIVLVGVGDPVAIGVVDSLAEPGGNATGLALSALELISQQLQLLQELVPGLRRVAIIIRNDPGLEQKLLDIRSNAHRRGLELVELEVTSGRALDLAFTRLRNDRCGAIYVASGPLGPDKRAQLIALAADARLPAIYSYRIFPIGGGLMSFAPDDNDLFRRAATFIDKLLKGAKPADLPVGEPTKFELVVNLRTAKALGLAIPDSILARANEVIE